MKWFILAASCLVACVSAGPLKDSANNATISLGKNETLAEPSKNSTAHSRVRRDCGLDDLAKLQAKVTFAVEQQIVKLLKGDSLPELPANRTRREAATSAAAGSVASPDGQVKSTAVTKGDSSVADSGPVPVPAPGGAAGAPEEIPAGEPRNLSVPIIQGNNATDGHLPAPLPGQGLPEGSVPAAAGAAGQPLPAEGVASKLTIQKVKASANKEKGTAVASAIAKRAVHQELSAEGDKAISKAESHKGGDSHLQNVGAEGTHLGIASASIDGKNNLTKSGANQDTTLQNVKASGEKAVATAAKKTDGGNTIQGALAEGEELSIASVSTGSEEQHPDAAKLVKRSVCLPGEITDNLRLLIRTTVENAFADVKHEMHF